MEAGRDVGGGEASLTAGSTGGAGIVTGGS